MQSAPKTLGPLIDRICQRPLFFFFLIFFLIVASYSNTLHSPTVLDDENAILQSSRMYLSDLSFESISGLAKTSFGISRFIPLLSFSLNHYFSGGRIIDYHLTNIAIHLATFLFFYLFLRKLLGFHQKNQADDALRYLPAPLFIALTVGLWALNPVQTNAVTYLVQRMTALCALFYVAALFFYLKGRQESRLGRSVSYFVLTGVCALGAFMSKENSATLPIVIILVESFFISPGSITHHLKKIKPGYWITLAFFALLALPIAQSFLQTQLGGYSGRSFTVGERLMTEARVVVWYISLLICPLPSRMNLDHHFPISHSLFEPWGTSIAILLILALLFSAIKYKKKYPLYSFGILWFFINLVIESTIIPLEIIFEHRLYLPSMGLFIATSAIFATGLGSLSKKFKAQTNKELLVLVIIIILSIMSVLTTFRNKTWFSVFTIYQDNYLKSPNKPRAITNMALAYAKEGDKDKAMPLFYQAISKGSTFSEEYVASANNIVTSLIEDNKFEEAMLEGERLYKNIPPKANGAGLPTLLYSLGLAYQKNHKLDLALEAFKQALRVRRDPYKDLYIYNAVVLVSREISQEKSRKTPEKTVSQADHELYALVNLFDLTINCRDYNFTKLALTKIKEQSLQKHNELSVIFADIQNKNRKSAAISEISQHQLYIADSSYRNKIKTMSFINKRYSPLKFVARNILTTMRRDYPDDPFVMEMYIGSHKEDFFSSAGNTAALDILVDKYSDSPPILSHAAKLYLKIGANDKALATIDRLLNIYPAHPEWLYWEHIQKKMRIEKNGN